MAGIKAYPIVFDREDDACFLKGQSQQHLAGGGVLVDVVEGLLGDAEEGSRLVGLQRWFGAMHIKLGCQRCASRKSDQLSRQRVTQRLML